jgi:DNA (cytosine-5)-methyltransferase 1
MLKYLRRKGFERSWNKVSKKSKKVWKVLDLFSGAGGLSNGFEQTGNFEVIGAVENNTGAAETYIMNHNNNPKIIIESSENNSNDITKIEFNRVLEERDVKPSETIILGGPPCQGFSNANRQRNEIISSNNLLVKEFARAVYQVKPVAFLMENVKTMNSGVHKFFVQKNGGENKDIQMPSCRRDHLEWLNKEGSQKITLNDNEYISILNIYEDGVPETWANYIQENYHSLGVLLRNKESVSTLRSLERRARKKDSYTPDTSAVKQVQTLLEGIVSNENKPWNDEVNVLIKRVLQPLTLRKTVEINKQHSLLKKIVVLNNAISSIDNLIKNKIEIHRIEYDKSNKEVRAIVTTYNVVEYLKAFFENLGYEIHKDVLTASDFGVPQKRNRFFIMGVKSEFIINAVEEKQRVKLPSQSVSKIFNVYDAIADLENIDPETDIKNAKKEYKLPSYNLPLLNYYRNDMEEEEKDKIFNHVNTETRNKIKLRYEAIKERGGRNSKDVQDLFKDGYSKIENIQNTVYLRLDYQNPSPTVVNVRKSMWSHPEKARAISIREAARLQSFKDNFKFSGKKDSQYQQIGNAVPPLLARAIAVQLLNILGEEPLNSLENELAAPLFTI